MTGPLKFSMDGNIIYLLLFFKNNGWHLKGKAFPIMEYGRSSPFVDPLVKKEQEDFWR